VLQGSGQHDAVSSSVNRWCALEPVIQGMLELESHSKQGYKKHKSEHMPNYSSVSRVDLEPGQ